MAEKISENITYGNLKSELRKPGDVYVAALVKEDVMYVRAVKSDLVKLCEEVEENNEDGADILSGWSAARLDNNALWLDTAH